MKRKQNSFIRLGFTILFALALIGGGIFYTASVMARGRAVGTENAVRFARIDAGIDEEEVTEQKASYVRDSGEYVYRVALTTDAGTFLYTVRASDGMILEKEGDFDRLKKETVEKTGPAAAGSVSPAEQSPAQKEALKIAADSKTVPSIRPQTHIGVDRAKQIGVNAFGLSAEDVTFTKAKLEKDDGKEIYEIEFYTPDSRYECDIDAFTGKLLESSSERKEDPVNTAAAPENENQAQSPETTAVPEALRYSSGDEDREDVDDRPDDDGDEIDDRFDDDGDDGDDAGYDDDRDNDDDRDEDDWDDDSWGDDEDDDDRDDD